MNSCILHLGSNLGDPLHQIEVAELMIGKRIGVITAMSYTYITEPWGNTDQDPFINKAVCVSTTLTPHKILGECLTIETKMGRKRNEHWGPRLIDIDILFIGDLVIKNDDLIVPHPRLTNRNFVLVPLMDICPDKIHPELNKTITEIYRECTDNAEVRMLKHE